LGEEKSSGKGAEDDAFGPNVKNAKYYFYIILLITSLTFVSPHQYSINEMTAGTTNETKIETFQNIRTKIKIPPKYMDQNYIFALFSKGPMIFP
jgi:hypothetical protein